MEFTTFWNINTSVGLWAERLSGFAKLDADSAVLVQDVVDLTVITLVELAEIAGLVIMIASFNGRQTLLVIISGEIAGLAEQTDFVNEVNVLAVFNDTNAVLLISTNEVIGNALTAS